MSENNSTPETTPQLTGDNPRGTPSTEVVQPRVPDTESSPRPSSASTPRKTSPQFRGVTLRSGTILQGSAQVRNRNLDLESYLKYLEETVRETHKLSVPQCDVLDKQLTQTREQRLAKVRKFKEDTERFKEELLKFEGFSHSLIKEKSVRVSESEASSSEPSASEIVLNWLGDSLLETSLDDTSIGTVSFSHQPGDTTKRLKLKMADYAKVAKLAAQLIPLFSGEPHPKLSLELQTFLGCCRQVTQCISVEEQTAFLQIFPTRLRGEAYQLFASNIPATFKEVEERLNRTYLPRETYQELVNRLITTRQYPREALATFTSRIKQSLVLCKEAAETKYSIAEAPAVKKQLEDFAKNALKTGVHNPHLCQYLLTLGDESLEALILKALDMERLQQSAFKLHSPAQVSTSPYDQLITNSHQPYSHTPIDYPASASLPALHSITPFSQYSQASNLRTTQDRNYNHRQPNKNVFNNKNKVSNINCSFCSKKGHTYADCFKRKNTPYCERCKTYGHDVRECSRNREPTSNTQAPQKPRDSRDQQKPRVYNVRLKCDFCGRSGHTLNECRQKQKWEAQSQGNDVQSAQNSPARF